MARHFLPDVFGRGSGTDMFSSLQREIDRVFQDSAAAACRRSATSAAMRWR